MAENSSSGATLPIAGVLGAVAPQDALVTDDWPAYQDLPVSGTTRSRSARWRRTSRRPGSIGYFQNLKCWGVGVYHGLRKPNLQHYLDEFVSRFKSAPDTACRLRYSARHQHRTTQSCLTCNNI